jgi:hypothetical protein
MSMELPVIATFWSGPTAYLDDSNGYPLNITGLEQVAQGPFADHLWASPSIPHLRQLMRHVYTHQEEARMKGKAARQAMVDNFTPAKVSAIVMERLQKIVKKVASL